MTVKTLDGHLLAVFGNADPVEQPFRHWLLDRVLPERLAREVCLLPFDPPAVGDTMGKRETHNSTRVFFSPENRDRFPVVRDIAAAFQSPALVRVLAGHYGTPLSGSSLRIEYCQDVEGFWLEPHTDIAAKLITIVIYLSATPDAEDWGTDLYDGDREMVGRAPGGFNKGLVFVPGRDTWHGYAPRPMHGIRRSLIVNFVTADWRARHELAFPDQPCAA